HCSTTRSPYVPYAFNVPALVAAATCGTNSANPAAIVDRHNVVAPRHGPADHDRGQGRSPNNGRGEVATRTGRAWDDRRNHRNARRGGHDDHPASCVCVTSVRTCRTAPC